MVTRDDFLAEARSWIGVPWLHQGRNRFGVDCIGLLLVTCWALDLSDYDVKGYGRTPNADLMRRECDRLLVRTANPQPGDVMLFRLSKELLHVLIRTERGILHAWAQAGKVAEVPFHESWQRRIAASYRVPGVA